MAFLILVFFKFIKHSLATTICLFIFGVHFCNTRRRWDIDNWIKGKKTGDSFFLKKIFNLEFLDAFRKQPRSFSKI